MAAGDSGVNCERWSDASKQAVDSRPKYLAALQVTRLDAEAQLAMIQQR
jgi:hypothetical protein